MFSKHGVYAGSTSRKAKRRNSIIGITSAVGVALTAGGIAWAAMSVTSNEANAKVEAGTVVPLQLSDAVAVDGKKLFPGTGVTISFTVKNPNPIPVTITSVVAGSATPTVTCVSPADVAKLSSSLLVSGSTLTLPTPIQLDAGEQKVVAVANAVKLASTATGGCTIEGKFKLSGTGAGTEN